MSAAEEPSVPPLRWSMVLPPGWQPLPLDATAPRAVAALVRRQLRRHLPRDAAAASRLRAPLTAALSRSVADARAAGALGLYLHLPADEVPVAAALCVVPLPGTPTDAGLLAGAVALPGGGTLRERRVAVAPGAPEAAVLEVLLPVDAGPVRLLGLTLSTPLVELAPAYARLLRAVAATVRVLPPAAGAASPGGRARPAGPLPAAARRPRPPASGRTPTPAPRAAG
ncbi:hypothetical protein EV189_0695 [Motilibacter rhizosphaerae]|uniref:Uncharacterized protein n=1 Tax=Motilibacter rhizosphaerae TaxID=598652 RepID=A0A4Q7NWA3_9ACTN|nr:hypothetical protein [Motilibacter rhizosphaerae]RZS91454.1 hypothetical protein EV189_0695 [Motilibacter rhizosphaerae]